MQVKTKFDSKACKQRIEKKLEIAQKKLDSQVMVDSNFYCPQRDGDLQRSVLSSKIGSGLLTWRAEYAREQYYGRPNKSKDKNPYASMKWFEVAKVNKLKQWEALVQREYNR
jgi:hypothetical protein